MPVRLFLLATLAASSLFAADTCGHPVPAVQQQMDVLDAALKKMPYAERQAYHRKELEQYLAQHPDAVDVHRRYLQLMVMGDSPDEAVRARYVEQAKQRPGDAVAQELAADALMGRNTPEAIRLLDRAQQLDPKLSSTYLAQIGYLSRGRFADKAKAAVKLDEYFKICPDSGAGSA